MDNNEKMGIIALILGIAIGVIVIGLVGVFNTERKQNVPAATIVTVTEQKPQEQRNPTYSPPVRTNTPPVSPSVSSDERNRILAAAVGIGMEVDKAKKQLQYEKDPLARQLLIENIAMGESMIEDLMKKAGINRR